MASNWERFLDPFVKREMSGSLKGTEEGTRMSDEEFEDYVTRLVEEVGMARPEVYRDDEGRVIGEAEGYGGNLNLAYVDSSVQLEPHEFGRVNLDTIDPVLKVDAEMPYSRENILDEIQGIIEDTDGYEGSFNRSITIGNGDFQYLQD